MGLIGRWMAYKGWTPMMFAKKANIRPSSVSHLLKDGVRHQESTIEKYAPIFGVSVTEFLAGPPRMTTAEATQKYDHLSRLMREEQADAPGGNTSVSPSGGMTTNEMIGKITSLLCTLDTVELAKVLGYAEALAEKETKESARKDVTRVS